MEELKEYTAEDFLYGTEPYEFLYQNRDNKFVLGRLLDRLAEMAKSVAGITNFKTQFKNYCEMQERQTKNEIYGALVTNFTGQPIELVSGNWLADDSGITATIGDYDVQACIHPILPTLRLVNIDTGVEKLEIAYRKGKTWRRVIADKKTLASASAIISLADVGIAVNSENSKYLVRYLHDIENINYDRIPEKNSVSRLGWIDGEGFSPYVEDLIFDGEGSFKTHFDSVREYGDYGKWLEVMKNIRETSLCGRLVLAASFSSCLVKPLGCLPFFVHLWGGTEVGKTVGLMVAASVWANPEPGRYIHTFNSTAVGREKTAAFVNNMPLILDELQIVSDKKQFDKDIYMLSEGAGKTRGNKQGGVDNTPTWSNCIITSGEMPITTSNSGGGAVNRIIEVECKEKIFANPREVADTIRNNYGFAGRKFVEWLQDDVHMKIVKNVFNTYMKELESTDSTDKQRMAISVVLTADYLIASEIFHDDKNLQISEIVDFLKTTQEVSIHGRAYTYLCEYVTINKIKFDDTEKGEKWGTTDQNMLYIIRSQFEKICNEANFNAQALLSWLKQNNMIEATKGYTKAKRINGYVVSCVWLKRPEYVDTTKQLAMEEVAENDADCPF
ncbi:MAG: DUF927 domain-containing protein [Ruminococcaceae bacterium]|nr:DUF927 domain-containing protein [Oscillospiraceae bacterium]